MGLRGPTVAVVGHVEWVRFARVEHVPRAGEVVHARAGFDEPAGGGAVAAVQLARLAGSSTLVTALGDDERARLSLARLRSLGVEVRAFTSGARTRTALTLLDDAGERTITTFGERLEPEGAAELWEGVDDLDAVYFTAGDVAALRLARERSRVLVASPRARAALGHGVELDALVLSGDDEIELAALAPARSEARVLCFTEGERGGRFETRDGRTGSWSSPAPPGPVRDSYGCGDSFAAGLAYGLGSGLELEQALSLGARCGSWCASGRGPYERQLSGRDIARAR